MSNAKISTRWAWLAVMGAVGLTMSCKARYGTVHANKTQSGSGAASDEVPPPTEPSPSGPGNQGASQAPSADLEVVWQGQVVTSIPAGTTVILRPTEDTMDGDDREVTGCRNPGIVKATFVVDGTPAGTVERTNCEPLEVEFKFEQVGSFSVKMDVESDEGEKASAEATVQVREEADDTEVNSFVITATPLIQTADQPITFTGSCQVEDAVILWNFGDGTTGSGVSVSHKFEQFGPIEVSAVCFGQGDESLKAKVTVLILPIGNETIGSETQNPDGDGGDGGESGDGGDGGDGGGGKPDLDVNPGGNGGDPSQSPSQSPTQKQ